VARNEKYCLPRAKFFRGKASPGIPIDSSLFQQLCFDGGTFAGLEVPVWLIISEDDPFIPVASLSGLGRHPLLIVVRSKFGGPCGFIENYRLESWIDRFVADILANETTSKIR